MITVTFLRTAAVWAGLLLFALGPTSTLSAQAATDALYRELEPDAFMTRWQVLAPIPVAEDATQDTSAGDGQVLPPTYDAQVNIDGKTYSWRLVISTNDIVDLGMLVERRDFSIAYACAELDMPSAEKGFLGIGSDDGLKVWLNGKPIHTNWVDRATQPDDDLVPVAFRAGRNHLLLKIQNVRGDWSFACRLLGQEAQAKKLIVAASQSDLKATRLLLDHGVDVHAQGPAGLTAVQCAILRGDHDLIDFLASRGADQKKPLPPLNSLIDGLLNSVVKSKAGGVALLVAKDGQILYEHGYGLANVENEVPVTLETKFRIGSISKQFTAAAILKLQEENKLSVTDKLSKYLSDYPRGDEVTIHHLLTHTSGIHSYTGKPDFMGTVTVGIKPLELINSFKGDPYDFEPGAKWLYNNSGYFLLGYIIERVSDRSYGEYLQQTFFAPLGMKDTGVHQATAILPHEATGYSWQNGRVKKAIDWDMSKAGGAGALYSTIRDLYRWNEALFNGKVLSELSRTAAFTPVRTAGDDPTQPKVDGYGYGWGIGHWRGLTEIGHSGGLDGFLSNLIRLSEPNCTIVVLMNCAPPPAGVDPGFLSHRLAEFSLHEKLAPLPRSPVDSAVSVESLDAIAGRYDYGQAVLVVRRQDKQLFARLTGQPEFPIFPASETNFFWKVVEARVTFVRDENGKVLKAVHEQGGAKFDAPRMK